MTLSRKKPLLSLLGKVSPFFFEGTQAETRAAWLSFFIAFVLMTAYYILRPIRDAMASNWTDTELSTLFTATFISSLTATALYGIACSRMRPRRLMPAVYLLFSISFLFFFVVFFRHEPSPAVNATFYVWVSVFSLFQISVFWTLMADTFSREQAVRLFGFISAGLSAGAVLGPALTLVLVNAIGKPALVLVSAMLLLACAILIGGLDKPLPNQSPAADNADASIGGNPFSGFRHLVSDPHVLGIASFIFLYTVISTFVYFQLKNSLVGFDETTRTQVWSGLDLAVNTCSILVALLVTGRLTRRIGLAWILALIPAVVTVGLAVIAIAPLLWILVGLQFVRRAGDYAITKPGREMLFTAIEREKRYKAKSILDNVVYRGGDAAAAWVFTALSQGLGIGIAAIAAVGAGLSLAWGLIGFQLGKRHDAARHTPP